MSIRNSVRQFLRIFGHALVSSVHDRLTGVELRLDAVNLKLDHAAARDMVADRHSGHVVKLLNDLAAEVTRLRSDNQGLARQLQELAVQNQELAGQTRDLALQNQELAGQTRDLALQNQELAYSDSALLQGSIHLVESFKKLREVHDAQSERLARVETLSREVNDELTRLRAQADQSAGTQRALLESSLGRIDRLSMAAGGSQQALEAVSQLRNEVAELIRTAVVQQVCVETADYGFTNPEVGLICYLYSYLPSRRAIDVGAHIGDVSDALLKAGYEVFAFEPYPVVYQKLVDRIGDRRDFHPFPIAIGSTDAEMSLNIAADLSPSNLYGDTTLFSSLIQHSMPDDLHFTGSIPVSTRTLANLHREGTLPADIGLLKIDTEGFDLEVIRGAGEHRYPVVAAEFWDTGIPFGKAGLLYTFEALASEMKSQGYSWHVVLFRVWGRNQSGFYCDHPRSVPNSWGNVFFFREFQLFAEAQKWCSAVLPRTYFKPEN